MVPACRPVQLGGVYHPTKQPFNELFMLARVALAGFHDFCGYSLGDVRGEVVGSLGLDGGMEQHFRKISEVLRNWQYSAAELDTTKHTFEVRPG